MFNVLFCFEFRKNFEELQKHLIHAYEMRAMICVCCGALVVRTMGDDWEMKYHIMILIVYNFIYLPAGVFHAVPIFQSSFPKKSQI